MSAAAELEALVRERDAYREALGSVLLQSLLNIRRAAFAPEIGTRMTERYRADIASACAALEDSVRAALERGQEGPPPDDERSKRRRDIIADAKKAIGRYEREDFDRFDDLCLPGWWVELSKLLLRELEEQA